MTGIHKKHFLIIILTSLVITLPLLIWDFPDQEDLHTTLFSTFYYSQSLFSGEYPFWSLLLGFGTPQPFASHLLFHPLIFFFSPENIKELLFAFYNIQFVFGAAFIYLGCKKIGANDLSSLLGAVTFVLCSTSTFSLFIKMVPSYTFVWTLLPAIFFFLISIYEQKKMNYDMFLNVMALGLLISLLLVCGHVSLYAAFGISFSIFVLYLIIKSPVMIVPLLGALILGFLACADKAYLLISEYHHSLELQPDLIRASAHSDFNLFTFWSTFIKPMVPVSSKYDFIFRNVKFGNRTDPIWNTLIFFGPPYALITLYMIVTNFEKFSYRSPLILALSFSLMMLFLPENVHKLLLIPAGNLVYSAPVILFSIYIGSVGITKISKRMGNKSFIFLQLFFIAQVSCLLLGTIPYIIMGAKGNNHIGHVEVLSNSERLAEYIKNIKSSHTSRIYLSPEVGKNGPKFMSNWGGEVNNSLAILGVPQVNGYFKFTSMNNYYPSTKMGDSQIYGSSDVLLNKTMLDVLGIEYLFVLEGEKWHPDLIIDNEFEEKFKLRGANEKKLILLHNPSAWSQVTGIQGNIDSFSLPVRGSCENKALLCRDYSQLKHNKIENIDINTSFSKGGSINIEIESVHQGVSLFISQTYRPGWHAKSSEQELRVRRALENFLVVDIPSGVNYIELAYTPYIRVLFTVLQWLLIGGMSLVIIIGCVKYMRVNLCNNTAIKNNDKTVYSINTLFLSLNGRKILIWWAIKSSAIYCVSNLMFLMMRNLSLNIVLAEIIFYIIFLLGFIIVTLELWLKILKEKFE